MEALAIIYLVTVALAIAVPMAGGQGAHRATGIIAALSFAVGSALAIAVLA